jgi:hypothetical protein
MLRGNALGRTPCRQWREQLNNIAQRVLQLFVEFPLGYIL